MSVAPNPPPVREALDEVVGTTRTLLLKRIDLLQLEAEHLLDDAALRLSEASAAVVLGTLSLVCGTVALVAWLEPHAGLSGASAVVAGAYGILATALGQAAKRRRSAQRSKAAP